MKPQRKLSADIPTLRDQMAAMPDGPAKENLQRCLDQCEADAPPAPWTPPSGYLNIDQIRRRYNRAGDVHAWIKRRQTDQDFPKHIALVGAEKIWRGSDLDTWDQSRHRLQSEPHIECELAPPPPREPKSTVDYYQRRIANGWTAEDFDRIDRINKRHQEAQQERARGTPRWRSWRDEIAARRLEREQLRQEREERQRTRLDKKLFMRTIKNSPAVEARRRQAAKALKEAEQAALESLWAAHLESEKSAMAEQH